jgi:hypothetical protein
MLLSVRGFPGAVFTACAPRAFAEGSRVWSERLIEGLAMKWRVRWWREEAQTAQGLGSRREGWRKRAARCCRSML